MPDGTRSTVPGVILAGGLARRMGGGDKGRLAIAGTPLVERVIARLSPQCAPLALNANGDPDRFADLELPVIADTIDGFAGPLAGVLAGLDWASDLGADRIVTVAADTPFFPEALASRLLDDADRTGAPIALAATPHDVRGTIRHPTFGLWSVALREDLRAALTDGLRKVVQWTERHGAIDVVFQPRGDLDPFFNVNTPDDLARAESHAAGTAA